MRTKPGMAHIHLTFSQPQAAAFRLATGNATDCASWPRPTACQKRWQQHSQQNPGIRGHSRLLAKMQSQISIWVAESLNCQLMRCPEFLFQSRAEPKVFKPSHILKVSEKNQAASTNRWHSHHEIHSLAILTRRGKDMRQPTTRQDQE